MTAPLLTYHRSTLFQLRKNITNRISAAIVNRMASRKKTGTWSRVFFITKKEDPQTKVASRIRGLASFFRTADSFIGCVGSFTVVS